MLKIIFKQGQGLGNQLWLFASAKSISEKLNYDLTISGKENFKGLNFLELDCNNFDSSIYHNQSINKFKMSVYNEKLFYDNELKYIVSGFDDNVLNIKENTILEGLFQSENYFFNDFEKLSRYIQFKCKKKYKNKIEKDTCILNIRGGEYKRHKDFILPKSYWEKAIKNFKEKYGIKKFKIVTDDYRYAKSLFPYYEIIYGNIEKCYAAIYECRNIIVSNSTFSYFPCRTGQDKIVIAPMYWARPAKNKGRWISPANIYKDWIWQDQSGNLFTYEKCIKIAYETEDFYKNNYKILVNRNFIPSTGIFNFIPKKFKSKVKNILSYLFPRKFG